MNWSGKPTESAAEIEDWKRVLEAAMTRRLVTTAGTADSFAKVQQTTFIKHHSSMSLVGQAND